MWWTMQTLPEFANKWKRSNLQKSPWLNLVISNKVCVMRHLFSPSWYAFIDESSQNVSGDIILYLEHL